MFIKDDEYNSIMKIKTSAPTKIIFFGEHYVVYGAPALSVAVNKRREVELESVKAEPDRIVIENPVYNEGGIIYPDGSYEGHKHVEMHAAIYREIYSKEKELAGKSFVARFLGGRIFKGMGASSALGASLALGLYTYLNKEVNEEEIFRCAQIGDTVDHGGRPSGVDARTVVHGGMIKFWREFNPNKYNFERKKIELPEDTTILIVDTYKGERSNTGDLVKKFAERQGITVKPEELSEDRRKAIIEPYMNIYESAIKELRKDGDPQKLGELMLENHRLLRENGMSWEGMEEVVKIIMDNGGLGAKITGAGGVGGAMIGLVYRSDLERIREQLKIKGYDSLELEPTNEGVRIDNRE